MTNLFAYCRKLGAAFSEIQKYILIGLCIAITAINISQIVGRYVFFYSIPWSEQISVILFIFIIFLGQNLATKKDNEIRIDIVLFQGAKAGGILLLVADLLCLGTLAVLFVSSIQLVQNSLRFPQVVSSVSLPYYYVFSVLPVGFALIFLSRLSVFVKRIIATFGHPAPQTDSDDQ